MTDQLTLDQSLQEIFPTLPLPIQRFIKEGKHGDATQTIMDRYVLHVDQGAIIEHQLLLALFGVIGPEEFMETLSSKLSVSDDVVGNIIEDVNKEVFIPIREEMRKGSIITPAEVKPPQVQAPRQTAQMGRNEPFRAPSQRPDLRSVLSSITREVPKPISLRGETPKLLEDHEEPHIEINPASLMATKGVEKPQPPPNLPGIIQPPVIPSPKPIPPPIPIIKEYSSDPYREPIE